MEMDDKDNRDKTDEVLERFRAEGWPLLPQRLQQIADALERIARALEHIPIALEQRAEQQRPR